MTRIFTARGFSLIRVYPCHPCYSRSISPLIDSALIPDYAPGVFVAIVSPAQGSSMGDTRIGLAIARNTEYTI